MIDTGGFKLPNLRGMFQISDLSACPCFLDSCKRRVMMLDTLSGYIPKQCVCQTLTDLVGGNMACLMPSMSLEFSMNSVNNRNFGSMSRHAMFRYKPDSITALYRVLSASGLVDLVQNIACLLQSTRSRSSISFVDKRSFGSISRHAMFEWLI